MDRVILLNGLLDSLRSEFTANLEPRFAVTRLRFDVQTDLD